MNRFFSIIMLSLLFSCSVVFDKDLEDYVEDIAGRTPLDFGLSGSQEIDGVDSINLGYRLSEYSESLIITNNEDTSIRLLSYSGLTGDFTVEPFSDFTLASGENFLLDASYSPSGSNNNSRVVSSVVLSDKNGREYKFNLCVTSRRQPLTAYDSNYNVISGFDLGAWGSDRRSSFILKNEGLTNLNITSIQVPNGIRYNGESLFTMAINEERSIDLNYIDSTVVLTGDDLIFYNDNLQDSEFPVDIYAGGALDLKLLDENSSPISQSLEFGTYTTDADYKVLSFFLSNTTLKDVNIDVSFSSIYFNTDIGDFILASGNSKEFYIAFKGSGDSGDKNATITLREVNTNRVMEIYLHGYYSPI